MDHATTRRKPIGPLLSPRPRGNAAAHWAVLSQGFRPFFLGAGIVAFLAMAGWIGALAFGWNIGGSYGALNWHAHEMLFGYTSAALAGFLLTAIPNWTGRLPLSGIPLLALVSLWVIGRVAMAAPDAVGALPAAILDSAFLPTLAFVAGREIVVGRNWKNLKILAGVIALSGANGAFHLSVYSSGGALEASRFALMIYVLLIAIVGGRIIPSFTRNWLARAGSRHLPKPFSRFDVISIIAVAVAALGWLVAGDSIGGAALSIAASAINVVRLGRWQGWRTTEEPLLLILHLGYGFVPLGLLCVGLSQLGWMSAPSALHVLTVGAIGIMTFAVMTRASLGHTGRPLTASPAISVAYLSLLVAATIRPFAELLPSHYHLLLEVAGAAWLLAFAIFLLEYGPILCRSRRQ